ncbi:MAG TPA: hypothetical protein VJ823_04100, partial [Rhodanobacteraceae bacterium]|nr:hypothetical protein [Rhodanobacteraceae bacterium]
MRIGQAAAAVTIRHKFQRVRSTPASNKGGRRRRVSDATDRKAEVILRGSWSGIHAAGHPRDGVPALFLPRKAITMTTGRQSRALHQDIPLPRISGKLMAACAACALLLGVAQAQAATVVTDSVVSQSTGSQASVPVTFGQIFKAGDIPAGSTVTATLNGQPVALQVDTKATNPDGSLRHAVLTAVVPSLPGGGTLPLALSAGSPAASMAQGAPVSLSQLLATGYDAKVSVNLGGMTYSVNARGLLQAADLSGACGTWKTQCDQWLSGPLTSEWVVNGPVTSSAGSAYPNLKIYFAVRAYAGNTPGTVASVRTDIIVENTDAFAPQAQPQYTATLTSGSASYTSPELTQYTATRWHKLLWWNNAQPQVYLQQDTQYIQNSMAVSRYQTLQPDESFLAGVRQSCAPLDYCDQTKAMSNTGAQPAIGPLPRWTSVYITYPDVRAYNWMLANTDALGTYSVHYRDAATGWPVSIQKHPYVTIIDWAYANSMVQKATTKAALYEPDLLPNCTNNTVVTNCTTSWYSTGNPYRWDNEHQPAMSYVPYMVTGDYYYMSELAFGASLNDLWSNEGYRGFSQGLIDRSHGAARAKAWTLRNMAEAAYLLPDSYPLKAEFNAVVHNSLADWNAKYSNNPSANPLRIMDDSAVYSLNGGKRNGVAPWQHNFLTWSAGHAAELGFADAIPLRNWLAKFEIGLMTDWQNNSSQGYCWLEASAYAVQVKDASGSWLPSFTAAYAATFPTLVGLECNSPAMVTEMARLENKPWQAGEMHGYPYSSTGFPANFQIGIAAAADSGLPNAATAWSIFDSRSVKPSGSNAYNNYPNFAVLPRSASESTSSVPPPTNP